MFVHSWNAHTENYMPKEVSYLRICLKLVICINMNLIVGDIVNLRFQHRQIVLILPLGYCVLPAGYLLQQ